MSSKDTSQHKRIFFQPQYQGDAEEVWLHGEKFDLKIESTENLFFKINIVFALSLSLSLSLSFSLSQVI